MVIIYMLQLILYDVKMVQSHMQVTLPWVRVTCKSRSVGLGSHAISAVSA